MKIMKFKVNANSSRTADFRDFGLGLAVTLGFILVVGYLTTSIIEKKAAQAEAERIAVHLNMIVNRSLKKFPKGKTPLHIFKPLFKKIYTSPMLRMIEKVYALRVWDATGGVVWSSGDKPLEKYPFAKLPINPLEGVLAFKLDTHIRGTDDHGMKMESSDGMKMESSHKSLFAKNNVLHLITFIPGWLGKTKKGERPNVVFEVLSEPSFLFNQINALRNRIWLILSLSSLMVFLVVFSGMRRLKRLHAEGNLNRELLNSVVGEAGNPIILTNSKREIISWNSAAESLYGYTESESLGRSIDIIIHEDMRDKGNLAASDVFEKGESILLTTTYVRKNGTALPVSVKLSPVRDVEGNTIAVAGIHNDLSDQVAYEEQLLHQANFDALTELPNRTLAFDRLSQALARASREDQKVALMFVDLDKFKAVNDTAGHAAGDAVLVEASSRLISCLRRSDTVALVEGDDIIDTVARFGGDEFLIILPDIKETSGIETVARKVLEIFAKPFTVNGEEYFLNASIGIALYPMDGDERETLLRNADSAMYRAKAEGRNNYRFFSKEMNENSMVRLKTETQLRHALERNELTLHYQPIVDSNSEKVICGESLLRWNNPDLGNVPPDKFIPLAEESGLIVPIGEWVLRTACQDATKWLADGAAGPCLAVNVSFQQLKEKTFLDTVTRALQDSGLPPGCLELEITERLLIDDNPQTLQILNSLSEMGCHLAIDDFGTGYSALSYLKRFPFDLLKIDRSFVRDVTTDPEDAALTTAIIAMAHGLGLTVVGEGVETSEQLNFLNALSCDRIQGYYFSKPIPHEEFMEFLRNWKARIRRKDAKPEGHLSPHAHPVRESKPRIDA